jgi:hypothetical protein
MKINTLAAITLFYVSLKNIPPIVGFTNQLEKYL